MQQRNREIFIIIIKYANYCDLRMMETGQSHCEKWQVETSERANERAHQVESSKRKRERERESKRDVC